MASSKSFLVYRQEDGCLVATIRTVEYTIETSMLARSVRNDQVEMHPGKSNGIVRFRNSLRFVVIKCEHQQASFAAVLFLSSYEMPNV